jgi:hypothetical protein
MTAEGAIAMMPRMALLAAVMACAVALSSLPVRAQGEGWELVFEDNFERAELGDDWWATGLTRIENGELVIGREGDLGSSHAVCRRDFPGAIRLEYDAMAPTDAPCDLSAVLNGDQSGYSSGFFFGFGSQNNTTGRLILKNQSTIEYPATITPGRWHHVVCERDGARFRHIIDGETVLEYTHEGPLPGPLYPRIGLLVWHLGRFDNVRVFTKPEEVEVVQAPAAPRPGSELQVSARAYPAAGRIGVSVEVPPSMMLPVRSASSPR